jgi:hypothetical protein
MRLLPRAIGPVVLAFALLAGCKSMGGLASGLGHVAGGMAKVASGVGHVAGSMGHAMGGVARVASGAGHVVTAVGRVSTSALTHAAPAIARVAQQTLPIAEDIAEAALESTPIPDDPPEVVDDSGHPVSIGGPLIDNHDSCNQCPEDLSCDQCTGANGAVCRWTPAGAFARCESTN